MLSALVLLAISLVMSNKRHAHTSRVIPCLSIHQSVNSCLTNNAPIPFTRRPHNVRYRATRKQCNSITNATISRHSRQKPTTRPRKSPFLALRLHSPDKGAIIQKLCYTKILRLNGIQHARSFEQRSAEPRRDNAQLLVRQGPAVHGGHALCADFVDILPEASKCFRILGDIVTPELEIGMTAVQNQAAVNIPDVFAGWVGGRRECEVVPRAEDTEEVFVGTSRAKGEHRCHCDDVVKRVTHQLQDCWMLRINRWTCA